jgi:hypothetical protein
MASTTGVGRRMMRSILPRFTVARDPSALLPRLGRGSRFTTPTWTRARTGFLVLNARRHQRRTTAPGLCGTQRGRPASVSDAFAIGGQCLATIHHSPGHAGRGKQGESFPPQHPAPAGRHDQHFIGEDNYEPNNYGTTAALLQEMGSLFARVPGGSLSDECRCSANTSWTNAWQWSPAIPEFIRVATNANTRLFVTVNHGSGRTESAADWVGLWQW